MKYKIDDNDSFITQEQEFYIWELPYEMIISGVKIATEEDSVNDQYFYWDSTLKHFYTDKGLIYHWDVESKYKIYIEPKQEDKPKKKVKRWLWVYRSEVGDKSWNIDGYYMDDKEANEHYSYTSIRHKKCEWSEMEFEE